MRGENMGRTALEVGAGLGDIMAKHYIKRVLQVHGMARFARGLGASGDLTLMPSNRTAARPARA